MAARNRGSRKADAGAGSRPQGDGGTEVRDIGWGLTAEEEEDFFLRRVLFSVLVVVVVCIGFWFLVTTVRSAPGQTPALIAPAAYLPEQGRYTIRLLTFPAAREDEARRLAEAQAVRELAGQEEFRCLPLGDGQMALCVGSFESESSPEMDELLRRFRSFTAQDRKLFGDAAVHRVP